MAVASPTPTPSVAIPHARDVAHHSGTAHFEKRASDLLTPPDSTSPDPAAHGDAGGVASPPSINIEQEMDLHVPGSEDDNHASLQPRGIPLNKGALSDLDASAAITPSFLAKYHLPGIMLGNGPRPIRYVMGELTQSVPGFSRIPPAKARRIVVAALESRAGGGPDGNVTFCKTGWGRWDAHVKGLSRDSGVGSFQDGRMSPPRSERSSYAVSHTDSAIHMPGPPVPSRYRDQRSGGSWTASSIREEDERDVDMDVIEEAADHMSLDGVSDDSLSDMDDDTDDDDWAAVGIDALRKASLPPPNAPKQTYRAVSTPYNGRWAFASRRPSAGNDRQLHSTSVPSGGKLLSSMNPAMQTPEEEAAVAALLSLGSM